jgi:hypothetical protein
VDITGGFNHGEDRPHAILGVVVARDYDPPLIVSLHAIAGVRIEQAMLLPVIIHGHWVVALLDSRLTINFINVDIMHRLKLATNPCPSSGDGG